jgi:hypothetical protein
MKTPKFFAALSAVGLLAGCSSFSSEQTKKTAFEEGFRAGGANERKRRYWEERNAAVVPTVTDLPQEVPVIVPEHTAPDGVIIESHEASTSRPTIAP